MVTHTKRDAVWTAALDLATGDDSFEPVDVSRSCREAGPSDRTVQDVLRTMAADGWLEKEVAPDDGRRKYVPGPRLPGDR